VPAGHRAPVLGRLAARCPELGAALDAEGSGARFSDGGRFVARPGVVPTTGGYGEVDGVSAAPAVAGELTPRRVTCRVTTSLGVTTTDAVETMTP